MAKKRWQQFEEDSFIYLQTTYPEYSFVKLGDSDSTKGDIQVNSITGQYLFDIETKLSPCQAAQFTVQKESEQYLYSPGNKLPLNEYSSFIINYINEHPNLYSVITQKGTDIELNEEILINYLISHFREKNCKYILSSKSLKAPKILFPIDEIGDYFSVTAKIRRKRSGSYALPKKDFEPAINLLTTKEPYSNGTIKVNKNIIYYPQTKLDTNSLSFGDHYYLSELKLSNNTYKVRKKSNTNNPCVIFSLKLK